VTTTTWINGGRWRRRKKCRRVSPASFSYRALPSVYYHGVNGESLGGDAPRRRRRCHHRRRRRRRRHHRCRRRRDLGDSGEFRNRLRPGSGREHRQLDETAGESVSLPHARHEGSHGIRGGHGIVILSSSVVASLLVGSSDFPDRPCDFLDVVRHLETAPASPRRARPLRAVASCRLARLWPSLALAWPSLAYPACPRVSSPPAGGNVYRLCSPRDDATSATYSACSLCASA